VLRLLDRKVFEGIQWSYSFKNRIHTVTMTCTYAPRKIEFIQEHSYIQPDLAAIMSSIPSVDVRTTTMVAHGRNKPEAEQEASKNLMEALRVRMRRL
jgi:hypothetical protein